MRIYFLRSHIMITEHCGVLPANCAYTVLDIIHQVGHGDLLRHDYWVGDFWLYSLLSWEDTTNHLSMNDVFSSLSNAKLLTVLNHGLVQPPTIQIFIDMRFTERLTETPCLMRDFMKNPLEFSDLQACLQWETACWASLGQHQDPPGLQWYHAFWCILVVSPTEMET